MSELIANLEYVYDVVDEREFKPTADWPDSCFAYVPAAAKGPDGKKSLRKFPYKWPNGTISWPNVRNALARLKQAKIPAADKTRIRKLMQRLLKKQNPDYKPTEDATDEELLEQVELILMEPMHPDFRKIFDRFMKQYCDGSTSAKRPKGGPCKVGKNYYYAWLNKHRYKDDQPIAPQNKDREGPATAGVCQCGYVDTNPTEIPEKCPACEGDVEILPIFEFDPDCACVDPTQEDQDHVMKTMESFLEKKGSGDMHMHFLKILQNYQRYWGKVIGRNKFVQWLKKLKLDPTKAYAVQTQYECLEGACQVVKEAFRWLDEDPGLIQFYMEDEEAKYYKCLALTANVSMNDNDYEDEKQLNRAAWTLGWRPLNLNHDQDTTLAFPANRVDLSAYEDRGVECVIRVHNDREDVQDKIDDGDIAHVSIEGKPRGRQATGKGTAPKNYNFTALGLLETGESLPGDPVTYLEPLFVNESMGHSLVESLREEEHMDEESIQEATSVRLPVEGCGQCRFFEDLTNRTMKEPAAEGDIETDAFVTTTSGGVGPGVGVCLLLNRAAHKTSLVRKSDPACRDAQARDTPTDVTDPDSGTVDRTSEAIDPDRELELLADRTRLQDKNLELVKDLDRMTVELTKAREQLDAAQDKVAKLEKKASGHGKESSKLQQALDDARADRDKAKDKVRDLEVTVERRDEDIKAAKEELDRVEKQLEDHKVKLARVKEDLFSTREKRDELLETLASLKQELTNRTLEKTRIQEELADTSEELAERTREVSNAAQMRADQAKRMVALEKEIQELRTYKSTAESQLTDLNRRLKQAMRKTVIKI